MRGQAQMWMWLLTLVLVVSSAAAENVYLFRLKKLRNSFYAQIQDQVTSNDALVVTNYGDTLKHLVMTVEEGQADLVQEIAGFMEQMSKQVVPGCLATMDSQSLYSAADEYLKQCVAEAGEGAESVSEYVVQDSLQYQSKSSEFSLWFMESYLTDWEQIFGEEHYNAVYNALSDKVVHWDNVDSIGLYSFRQEVVKRLATLSTAVENCMDSAKAMITAQYSSMQSKAVNCSKLQDIGAMKRGVRP